jgi:hypothetical protein
MNFVHLKMELCNSKLCTPCFGTLYYKIWNFILLGVKLYHHENCFETYPTWIYFYRSRHNERNGENGIKNRCLTRKLSHFKVCIPFANAKKQIWYTTRCLLPSSHLHPRLGPHSPHTPHVCILLYGEFSMRYMSVRCYMAERTRVN